MTRDDPQLASRFYWNQHPDVVARVGIVAGLRARMAAALAPSLEIPDVSEHNGRIDWSEVRGVHAAIIRSSFGTSRADYEFANNWAGLETRLQQPYGIHKRLVYHYAYPDSGADGVEEAKFMVRQMRAQPGEVRDDDGWVLDAEDARYFGRLSRPERIKFCDSFMATAEDHLQRHGWFYSYVPFVNDYLGGHVPPNCRTWVARYANDMPSGSGDFVRLMRLWQHTDGAVGAPPRSVVGIGACDVSRIVNTDLDSFLNYGNRVV